MKKDPLLELLSGNPLPEEWLPMCRRIVGRIVCVPKGIRVVRKSSSPLVEEVTIDYPKGRDEKITKEIMRRYKQGETMQKISKKLGIGYGGVWRTVREPLRVIVTQVYEKGTVGPVRVDLRYEYGEEK